jgi:hypothetical protein
MKSVLLIVTLLCIPPAAAQNAPSNWKIVKDSHNICQMAVPPDWQTWGENSGAAILHDTTTAIAVVTSQPGQALKPLTESFQKLLGIPKDKLFENTANRVFYQDRTSSKPDLPNTFSVSVPGNGGTCSCRLTVLPEVSEDTARKIALSLRPVP